jgi:lysophospholipase L1-like esterase
MRKHFSIGVVSIALLIAVIGISRTSAVTSPDWITSNLSVQKQSDTVSMPSTLAGYGNIDCAMENAANCSAPTNYGVATSNSTIRFSSSNSFTPVNTYIDGRQHFFPVPNSDMAISYYSGPVYGLNLAFNYNFVSSIIKTAGTYTINRPPDGKLSDKAKHLLPADIASLSFSENGRWAVVSSPNLAILRVNLQTFEVVPFAPGFNYTIGLDPSVKTAISNDGRSVVVASNNFLTFKVYDLATCATIPDTIAGPVSCQSRDLRSFMQEKVPGFSFIAQARYMSDDTLAAYATYKAGNVNKTARFIISDSSTTHQHDLLALGDSYISGEGAFDYIGGTDTSSNKCHVSYQAYPYLIGKDLNYNSYHSVACSGAVTKDVIDTSDSYIGQAEHTKRSDRTSSDIDSIIASFLPGYIDQMDFVKTYQPRTVMLSIGGNDMGFSRILTTCVEPAFKNNCYNTYEDRLELVRQINTIVYPRLAHTYQQIKAAGPPDMQVYVIGYPQIAKPGGDCGLNVHLNSDEVLFSQELINYLDTVLQDAAAKSGVYYVDTQDALYGFRLCEAGPGAIAMNGLTAGNDRPTSLGGPIGDESYHPNATGYQLLENKILALTHNLTASMPAANPSVSLPSEASLEILNVPHNGRAINTAIYEPDMTPDVAYQQTPMNVSLDGSEAALASSSTLQAEIHSTPIRLGNFTTDPSGDLSAQLMIPVTVLPGYHTLHFYGTNLLGQPVDIYKYIYVARSAEDLDGDGALDSTQRCIGVSAAGEDFDQDGIDDSCDPDITVPPTTSASDGGSIGSTPEKIVAVQLVKLNSVTMPTPAAQSLLNIADNDIWVGTSVNSKKPAVAYVQSAQLNTPNKKNNYIGNIVIGGMILSLGIFGTFLKRRI